MITVNSISGGKTSCYMAIQFPADVEIFACVCIDYPKAAPKDPAILKYCLEKLEGNFIASAEHDKTLKAMMQLEQVIGKEIVWVRGKSFDQVIDEAGCLPTWNRRFCTTELKIIPIFQYVYPRFGKVKMQIGLRADEPERRKAIKANFEMHHPISCNLYGQQRMNWAKIDWREAACPLERIFHYQIRDYLRVFHPDINFPLDSNCRGCHHKPEELIYQNYKETPDHLEWFALQEKKKKKGAKFNTFKDSGVSYGEIFQMNFTEAISFDYTMCNSGGCTD